LAGADLCLMIDLLFTELCESLYPSGQFMPARSNSKRECRRYRSVEV
jgi:hypothetical protein